MTRDGGFLSVSRIQPYVVIATVVLEHAPLPAEVLLKIAALHSVNLRYRIKSILHP
jgi:hypothetical protein